jgi:hypothetical protein
MAGKVAALAVGAVTMLDDQKTVMHINPKDSDGNPTSLPTGSAPPTYAVDNAALVTLDTTTDPTGLSAGVVGVKKQAGVATITDSFTNADGTVATGTGTVTTTVDPKELDVSGFDVSFDTPVAQ